jgi:hypothetical protein
MSIRWCVFRQGRIPGTERKHRLQESIETMNPASESPTPFLGPSRISGTWKLLQPLRDAWTLYPTMDFPDCPDSVCGPRTAQGLISRNGPNRLAPTLPGSQL